MKMDKQPSFAGFWIRSLANLIDSIFYTAFPLLASLLLGQGSPVSFIVGNGAIAVYYVACLSSPWQGTLGKYALKIHVQTATGHKITPLRALSRLISTAIPVLPFTLIPFIYSSSMESLVRAFLSKDFFVIQRTMQANTQLVYALLGTSWFAVITMPIWFLPIVFTKQKTGIHDLICKTRVVHGRA